MKELIDALTSAKFAISVALDGGAVSEGNVRSTLNQIDSALAKQTRHRVWWEYIGEELAVFWESPYGQGKEKIATFWWPGHPVEATPEVEAAFEAIASRLSNVVAHES